MYLATSDQKINCLKTFCRRAEVMGQPPVLYIFKVDKDFGCVHVNYVDRTNCVGEREFLFVPYSVFTVESVEWEANPKWTKPHVITLKVAIDNTHHSENLPLSPWH
jgi:hypothetical protein